MMILMVVMKIEYGPMYKHEYNALQYGDLYTTEDRPYANVDNSKIITEGKVIDMLFPIITLVIGCVIGMIYTGGFFEGTSFIESFANSDASVGLVLGSFCAMVLTMFFYMFRKSLDFSSIMECIPEGFKQMVPAILILTFAWSLKAMTDSLGAKEFVAYIIKNEAAGFAGLLPFIIFLIAVGLSFATGTSWGTFGILIPIVVDCFQTTDYQLMIIAMSACMAGGPLLPHLRYDDHVLGRRAVQPPEPRFHADPLRNDLRRDLRADLRRRRSHQERVPVPADRPCDPDRSHVCAVQKIGQRERVISVFSS